MILFTQKKLQSQQIKIEPPQFRIGDFALSSFHKTTTLRH